MSSSSSPLAAATGFNSGLPINDIITQLLTIERRPINLMSTKQDDIRKQMNTYSLVQGKVNDLLTSIKKLTSRTIDGFTAFDTMTSASSDDKIATATTTAAAAAQSLTLEVKTLPTQTKATSTNLVGKFDDNTLLSDLGIGDGSFTLYVNGAATSFNVTAGQTIGSVFSDINAAFPAGNPSVPQVTASIVNGKVSLAYTGGNATTISFGTGGDTSNFLKKLHLTTAINNGTDTITASQGNTTINLNQPVSDAAANLSTAVTDGTFRVNGVSFDTTGKSLSQLVTEINASAAKVTASFNTSTNKLTFLSKDSGSAMIALNEDSGNFLTAMGLVNGTDTTSSQTAGKNAEFVLNGETFYSTSTTVDETVTGLTGVTLNLKKSQPGTEIQVTVRKDTDSLKSAIKDVIDKYNTAIGYIDDQTNAKNNGVLAKEVRLKSFRSDLRGLLTSQIAALSGTAYDSLQQIGITTGAIGSGISTGASPKLQLDESKLDAALAADAASVKKLFIGQDLTGDQNGGVGDDNMEGTFTKVFHLLADQTYTDGSGGYGALYNGGSDSQKGLFAAYQASAQKRIDDLNKSIQRAQDRLDLKEKTLRQQYQAMDKLVGQYQTQGNALNGLISSMSANK